MSPNDYFSNLFKENYAIRETILVDVDFIRNVRANITFKDAGRDAGKATDSQLRAIILLHEARHLYSLSGHVSDPSTHDGLWNDYILWTGFQGQKVAW